MASLATQPVISQTMMPPVASRTTYAPAAPSFGSFFTGFSGWSKRTAKGMFLLRLLTALSLATVALASFVLSIIGIALLGSVYHNFDGFTNVYRELGLWIVTIITAALLTLWPLAIFLVSKRYRLLPLQIALLVITLGFLGVMVAALVVSASSRSGIWGTGRCVAGVIGDDNLACNRSYSGFNLFLAASILGTISALGQTIWLTQIIARSSMTQVLKNYETLLASYPNVGMMGAQKGLSQPVLANA